MSLTYDIVPMRPGETVDEACDRIYEGGLVFTFDEDADIPDAMTVHSPERVERPPRDPAEIDAWFELATHVCHRLLGVAGIADLRHEYPREIGLWHFTRPWDFTIYEDVITLRRVAVYYGIPREDDLFERTIATFQALGCAFAGPSGERFGPDDRDGTPPLEDLDVPAGSRFRDALQFAALVHAGDVRKGTNLPYVSHLLAVASLVMEHGGSEDVAIAALLHDALEDHPETVTPEALETLFGTNVRRIVEACSDSVGDGVERDATSWKDRKREYLAHLDEAWPDELLVALADKVHNVRSILRDLRDVDDDREFWRRFNAGKAQQLWYYRSLAKTFARRFPGALADELGELVAALEAEAARRTAGRKAQ